MNKQQGFTLIELMIVVAIIGILAAMFFAPVLLFYFLASLSWRGQELRMIAQSMAQVAIRFSEPEGATSDSMVTVGQAIRREVAAMGDGVERAIARAGELETLVANEVSALERAYSDNEVRIRALLQDIAHQRDNLVGQAEQVRAVADLGLHFLLAVAEVVVGQDRHQLAQPRGIAVDDDRGRIDDDPHRLRLGGLRQRRCRVSRDITEIDRSVFEGDRTGIGPGKQKEIIDEGGQMVDLRANVVERLADGMDRLVAVTLEMLEGAPDDRQRGPQLVAHRRKEL